MEYSFLTTLVYYCNSSSISIAGFSCSRSSACSVLKLITFKPQSAAGIPEMFAKQSKPKTQQEEPTDRQTLLKKNKKTF